MAYGEIYAGVKLGDLKVLNTRLGAEVMNCSLAPFAEYIFLHLCKEPEFADPARVADVVAEVIQAVVKDWGGRQIAFPGFGRSRRKAVWDEIARREGPLYREDIAREMGVSERTAYMELRKRGRFL